MKSSSNKKLKTKTKTNAKDNIPRIRVCVRKRPANKKEIEKNDIDILEISGSDSLTVKELK